MTVWLRPRSPGVRGRCLRHPRRQDRCEAAARRRRYQRRPTAATCGTVTSYNLLVVVLSWLRSTHPSNGNRDRSGKRQALPPLVARTPGVTTRDTRNSAAAPKGEIREVRTVAGASARSASLEGRRGASGTHRRGGVILRLRGGSALGEQARILRNLVRPLSTARAAARSPVAQGGRLWRDKARVVGVAVARVKSSASSFGSPLVGGCRRRASRLP
jgi:hypothetical protein